MFNFEDEIVLGFSDRIPWLLLVNLLVMFLLIVLLCYFSLDIVNTNLEVVEDDQDHHHMSSSRSRGRDCTNLMINRLQGVQANQDPKIVNDSERTGTSNRRRNGQREIREEIQAVGDVRSETMAYSSYSPCHWLQLASKAFLSCFGLLECQDSTRNKQRDNNKDDFSSSSSGSKSQ